MVLNVATMSPRRRQLTLLGGNRIGTWGPIRPTGTNRSDSQQIRALGVPRLLEAAHLLNRKPQPLRTDPACQRPTPQYRQRDFDGCGIDIARRAIGAGVSEQQGAHAGV